MCHLQPTIPQSANCPGYDDAWWVTKLNISRGEYPENAFFPIKTSKGIDIGIRWSDGPVTCKNDASGFTAGVSSTSGQCSGYLEAYYAVSNETFFRDVSGEPMNPLGTVCGVWSSTATPSCEKLVDPLFVASSPVASEPINGVVEHS